MPCENNAAAENQKTAFYLLLRGIFAKPIRGSRVFFAFGMLEAIAAIFMPEVCCHGGLAVAVRRACGYQSGSPQGAAKASESTAAHSPSRHGEAAVATIFGASSRQSPPRMGNRAFRVFRVPHLPGVCRRACPPVKPRSPRPAYADSAARMRRHSTAEDGAPSTPGYAPVAPDGAPIVFYPTPPGVNPWLCSRRPLRGLSVAGTPRIFAMPVPIWSDGRLFMSYATTAWSPVGATGS